MESSLGIFRILLLPLIALFWVMPGPSVEATSCTVTTGAGSYPDLVSALNDSSCEVIYLPAGVYYENLTITRSVTIQGADTNSTIVDGNNAGRVISTTTSITVSISNLTIRNGSMNGSYGGGIANSGVMTLTNVSVINNTAYTLGGGIFNAGTLTLSKSSVLSNTVQQLGGGIVNWGLGITATLTVDRSTVAYNSASDVFGQAGGLYNASNNDGMAILLLYNSTVSENSAGYWSGAITSNDIVGNADVVISNTTIISNSAGQRGGGIYIMGQHTARVVNSIIASNNAPQAPDCYVENAATLASLGNNLVGNTTACLLIPVDGDQVNVANPQLGPLRDNGGPTSTHALLPGSPATDAGNNAMCLAIDQRGYSRPADGNRDGIATCDIGAYEFIEYVLFLPLVSANY